MLNTPKVDFCPALLRMWESDLQLNLTRTKKEKILYFIYNYEGSMRYQELNYKVIMKWYHTPDVFTDYVS